MCETTVYLICIVIFCRSKLKTEKPFQYKMEIFQLTIRFVSTYPKANWKHTPIVMLKRTEN